MTARLREIGLVVLKASLPLDCFDASPADGLIVVMNVLSGTALFLSALLIVNTVTALVGEQVAVVGVMKALGATHLRVMRGYLAPVLIYALAGTALGLFGGYQVTRHLADIVTLDLGPLSVDARAMAVALLIGLGAPMAAAATPLWFSTRITVREAISAHGTVGRPRSKRCC